MTGWAYVRHAVAMLCAVAACALMVFGTFGAASVFEVALLWIIGWGVSWYIIIRGFHAARLLEGPPPGRPSIPVQGPLPHRGWLS